MDEKLADSLISPKTFLSFFLSLCWQSSPLLSAFIRKWMNNHLPKPYHFTIKLNYLHRNKPEGWSALTRSIMKRKVFRFLLLVRTKRCCRGGGRTTFEVEWVLRNTSVRATPEAISLPVRNKQTSSTRARTITAITFIRMLLAAIRRN